MELILHNGELWHAEDLSDDTLAHYGVVGMKWGKRRARAKGKAYKYTSINTRYANRKLAKAQKSGDQQAIAAAKKRLSAHRRLDTKRQKMLEGRTKKQIRNSYLLTAPAAITGPGGLVTARAGQNAYRAARAEGNSRARAAAVGAFGVPGQIINRELNVRKR